MCVCVRAYVTSGLHIHTPERRRKEVRSNRKKNDNRQHTFEYTQLSHILCIRFWSLVLFLAFGRTVGSCMRLEIGSSLSFVRLLSSLQTHTHTHAHTIRIHFYMGLLFRQQLLVPLPMRFNSTKPSNFPYMQRSTINTSIL